MENGNLHVKDPFKLVTYLLIRNKPESNLSFMFDGHKTCKIAEYRPYPKSLKRITLAASEHFQPFQNNFIATLNPPIPKSDVYSEAPCPRQRGWD